jgi:hypothetical protein
MAPLPRRVAPTEDDAAEEEEEEELGMNNAITSRGPRNVGRLATGGNGGGRRHPHLRRRRRPSKFSGYWRATPTSTAKAAVALAKFRLSGPRVAAAAATLASLRRRVGASRR